MIWALIIGIAGAYIINSIVFTFSKNKQKVIPPIPLPTEPHQMKEVGSMAEKLKTEGFSETFINDVADLACYDQGCFDLLKMWNQETDALKKHELILDLEDEVEEYAYFYPDYGER
jgi:hypothetical protein